MCLWSMGDQSNPPELSGVKIPQEEEVEVETSGSKMLKRLHDTA